MNDVTQRSPLADSAWHYLDKIALEDLSHDDWVMLEGQRSAYLVRHQAAQALRLLSASEHDPCFGYQVNNYRHCLQSATMVLRDGLPEEDVVVALLHDVGFIACPLLHGDFAATLLGAYVSERNHWMLRHHAVFQNLHSPNMPGVDPHERERCRRTAARTAWRDLVGNCLSAFDLALEHFTGAAVAAERARIAASAAATPRIDLVARPGWSRG